MSCRTIRHNSNTIHRFYLDPKFHSGARDADLIPHITCTTYDSWYRKWSTVPSSNFLRSLKPVPLSIHPLSYNRKIDTALLLIQLGQLFHTHFTYLPKQNLQQPARTAIHPSPFSTSFSNAPYIPTLVDPLIFPNKLLLTFSFSLKPQLLSSYLLTKI